MSKLGDGISAGVGGWKFSGDTVNTFDDHVSKSVPLYLEGHQLICGMSDFFISSNSVCYEIGCSTGTLTLKLAEHHASKENAEFIGIDIEADMISKANAKTLEHPNLNVSFLAENILEVDLKKSDLIVCYYTIQFINPSVRQELLNKIYNSLNWGGALLLFEKVRGADARFQDILTTLYSEYKLRMGYSPEEIISKTLSLKGVMEPFSTQGNIDLMRRAGFSDINTIQKYLCFEGFLAIK